MNQEGLMFPKCTTMRKVRYPEELLYPKSRQTKGTGKKIKHTKSIMQKKDGTCFLCMILHEDYRKYQDIQKHHVIFGRGKRNLSEEYGLVVYLCGMHHIAGTGPEAVHSNTEICKQLQRMAQEAFEEDYPDKDFLQIFGKNYK